MSTARPGTRLAFFAPQRLLLGASFCVSFCSCGADREVSAEVASRPDLILISLDTLRQDHCTFHGYERETTPFLGELASESLVFDNAKSTCSWTLIAHMSMLTGLYPTQHGVYEAKASLDEEVPLLAEMLEAAGARTSGVHFPGWMGERFGFGRGFNVGYESARNADEAGELLEDQMRWGPQDWAFTFIHLFDIHSDDARREGSRIYDNPPPYDTMFAPDAAVVLDGIDATKAVYEDATDFTPEMREAVVGLYDGGIRRVDDTLADWFASWEEEGRLDNAIVIITSDHGEGLLERARRFGGHGGMFEEGLRVPLLMHFTPGAREWMREVHGVEESGLMGRRSETVSHVDIVPTILHVYDLPARMVYPGTSLISPVSNDRIVHAQRPPDHFVSYSGALKVDCDEKGRVIRFADLTDDPRGREESRPERDQRAAAMDLALRATQDRFSLEAYTPDRAGELGEAEKDRLRGLGYAREVR